MIKIFTFFILLTSILWSKYDIYPGTYVTLYKQNYLTYSYNSFQKSDSVNNKYYTFTPENQELNFQLSLKAGLFRFYKNMFSVAVAYTQKSMWQILAPSGPFRETNYNPEGFIETTDYFSKAFKYKLSVAHKSNGQGNDINQSRSMNYLYFTFYYQHRAWKIFTTLRGLFATETYFKEKIARLYIESEYTIDRNKFYIKISPAIIAKQKFNMEISYNLRLLRNIGLYAQYFYGFNETEIDFDQKVNRISVGFSLNSTDR